MSDASTGTLGGRLLALIRRPASAWRSSLLFRTVLISAGATTVAIVVATVWAALAIQADLYDARIERSQVDTARAIDFTQHFVNEEPPATDLAAIQSLRGRMLDNLATASSTDLIVGFPIAEQSGPDMPSGFTRPNDVFDESLLSDGFREQVRLLSEQQWYQPLGLPLADGTEVPAVVVGQQLTLPEVGVYEVYFAYPLSDVAQTLAYVQGVLLVTGIALVVIVGVVVWLVMRSVAAPVVDVSRASARFADGDLSARLVESGSDELATLAKSFNQMADSIEHQIRELAELSLVQQRFVSDVSHELRTPLTTIQLASEVIHASRDEFDPATARSAELLHDQVARFEQLLTDLLEISRYDAGSVELTREDASLSEIVEQVAESMRQVAWQNDTELRFRGADGDDVVEMDPRRVRRILRNLVGNAIEHGEREPVELTVAQDDTSVAVAVRDHGLGMKPEHVERVFDRFWRADPSRQRTLGGTGLGLSIALGDARLHGGTIDVWSQLGQGTQFVVTLPRNADLGLLSSPIRTEPRDALPHGDGRRAAAGDTETIVVRNAPDQEDA